MYAVPLTDTNKMCAVPLTDINANAVVQFMQFP